MADIPGVDTETGKMTPGPYVVEYELNVTKSTYASSRKEKISTGITGVPTKVYEVQEVDIDKDRKR